MNNDTPWAKAHGIKIGVNEFDIVILAAGKGTRMGLETPKVLVKLMGKPMINYLISSIKKVSSQPPIVVASPDNIAPLKKTLNNYSCRFVVQKEPLGIGHAVNTLFTKNVDLAENILILYGDHPLISEHTIKRLLEKHLVSKSSFSMLVASVPNFDGIYQGFYNDGRVIRNRNGNVERIVEPSDATDEVMRIKEINPAIFVFKTSWLRKNIDQIKINEVKREYYLTQLIEIAKQVNTHILPIEGDIKECFGINTKQQLEIVEKVMTMKHAKT